LPPAGSRWAPAPTRAAGWCELTEAGEAKRKEAQTHWKTAQQNINALLGVERVLALHLLVDEAMALLGGDEEPDAED
jgi:hypothetical protein